MDKNESSKPAAFVNLTSGKNMELLADSVQKSVVVHAVWEFFFIWLFLWEISLDFQAALQLELTWKASTDLSLI